MNIIFSTVQSILDNIMQDLEIQNLTNHLKFETLPYFSQIRAVAKPELSTFDADAEFQKVETSKVDSFIVTTYGMVDKSMSNEVFKRKNGFLPRINSFVNPLSKIKAQMNSKNNNDSSFVLVKDDNIDIYGLGDECILNELTKLEKEEALRNIQFNEINEEENHGSVSVISTIESRTNSQNNLSSDQIVQENENHESNSSLSDNNCSQSYAQYNDNITSNSNISNNNNSSQSYVQFSSNQSSNINISNNYSSQNHVQFDSNISFVVNKSTVEQSASNIDYNSNNMTNSNRSINKSDDMIQSNQSLSNSNSEINTTISYSSINSNGSRITNENSSASANQSVISITSQSRSQKSLNSSDNEHCSNPSLSVSSSNSIVQKVNSCFERNVSDPKESLESIPEDALLFPEVANGETLEIIQ